MAALLEAGCTNCQARAITGHSTDQMVNLYDAKVNQRRQAREAMDKVVQFDKVASENGWRTKIVNMLEKIVNTRDFCPLPSPVRVKNQQFSGIKSGHPGGT